tara:strand:- start:2126 stop:2260 length:135 start_codon:yes stop_codon:yes gene_type:complete
MNLLYEQQTIKKPPQVRWLSFWEITLSAGSAGENIKAAAGIGAR